MENQKNIPTLRFPEFSGEWERKKLGDVVDSKSKKYNPEREKNSFNCIELEHLTSETGQLLGFVDSINSGSIKNKFEIGDILFGKLRPYLRKYLKAPFDGVCSSEIWVLKGNGVTNDFLFYVVQTNAFVELANQSSGSKMPRADWEVVSSGVFSFPTSAEQQKIAAFLTAVDNKLTQLKKKKNLLEKYKKGVMQKIFSQEIRFKDDDGKDFPDWEEKKLGEVAVFLDGKRKPIKETDRAKMKGIYPYYGASGIIDFVNDYIFDEEIILLGEDGENIISRNLPLAFKVSGKCWVNNHAHVIKPNHKVDVNFLTQSLERISYVQFNTGTAQPKLNQEVCRGISLQIPHFSEQTKIVNFLSAIDNKINHTTTQIEKTQQWKKGLLQQMFV